MNKRLEWIDMARGLSIFLVIYGHNFPLTESYIYSFHVPLFFFIAGMFHPKTLKISDISKRAKTILLPYFFWAFMLFIFWFLIGRNYGNSSHLDLSPVKNFIGIFYAQGGQDYMDWGIPLWFLPCIFLLFLIFSAVKSISNKIVSNSLLLLLVLAGFAWPHFSNFHLPWSIDVALVAMGFYFLGNILKKTIINLSKWQSFILCIILLATNIIAYYYNPLKVDMYRSIYGNELLFFISGLAGSLAIVLFFKLLPVFNFFSYIGKHTIVLLAVHLRMFTIIKLVLLLTAGITFFEFSEIEKFVLAIVQVLMAIPIILLVNKYAPILDGKNTKS